MTRTLHTVTLLAGLLAGALPAAGAAQLPSRAQRDSVNRWVESLHGELGAKNIATDSIRLGARDIGRGEQIAGDVLAMHGTITVAGTVRGNVVAFGGDVLLQPGATVTGNVISVGGRVDDRGATINGETRQFGGVTGALPAAPRQLSGAALTRRALGLATGWFAVLVCMGVAVLLFARANLDAVVEVIRTGFGRAFLYGLLGQLGFIPVLVAVSVALAITIIGILAVPIAAIGLLVALAGGLGLGFLAMAYVSGVALLRRRQSERDFAPAPVLILGLGFYYALWVLAAMFAWNGNVGAVLRSIAFVMTWVALTVGFGAAILSRGGTRIVSGRSTPRTTAEQFAWETPTPVSGVTAARRPTPVASPRRSE